MAFSPLSVAAPLPRHCCTTAAPLLHHCRATAAPLPRHCCTTAAHCYTTAAHCCPLLLVVLTPIQRTERMVGW